MANTNNEMARLLLGYAPTQGMTQLSEVKPMQPNNPQAATIQGISGIVRALAEKHVEGKRNKAISSAITQAKAGGGDIAEALMKSPDDYVQNLGTQLQIMQALREPSKPQYIADPAGSGRVIAVDKENGTASYVPFANQVDTLPSGGNAPSSSSANIPSPPPGLSPKAAQAFQSGFATQAGKDAAKYKTAFPKAKSNLSSKVEQSSLVNDTIDQVADQANDNWWATGAPASVAMHIPGSGAYDMARNIETIKANIGFDKLQQMRDNSPTGGALGQVSEMENRLLQSTIANLDQSQSREQFLTNLQKVKDQYAKSTERLKQAYATDYGSLDGFDFGEISDGDKSPPPSGGDLQSMSDEELMRLYQQMKGGQ